jgi:hypothetical protein
MQGRTPQLVDDPSNLKPAMLRALQEAPGTAGNGEITYVSTANELQEALQEGARHIEIRQHLILTGIQSNSSLAIYLVKLVPSDSTWSIRVRPSCPCMGLSSGSSVFSTG